MKHCCLFLALAISVLNTRAQPIRLEILHNFSSNGYGPMALTGFGKNLCLTADDGQTGNELWIVDSTSAVTQVCDLNGFGSSFLPFVSATMASLNQRLFFAADDGVSGYQIFSYDGRNLPSHAPGFPVQAPGSRTPLYLTAMDGQLYYSAPVNNFNRLFRYDGLTAAVVVDSSSSPDNPTIKAGFIPFMNRLYLTGSTPAHGIELYAYDAAADSIYLVADVAPGKGSSDPRSLTVIGDRLYFTAANTNGRELYSYDGTTATCLTDVAPGALDGLSPSEHVIAELGGKIYFAGSPDGARRQLYRYDPVSATTELAATINTGADASPEWLTGFKNHIYFSARGTGQGPEPWRTDGTTTEQLYDLWLGISGSLPSQFYVWRNRLYFTALVEDRGWTLFRLNDPTAVGPEPEPSRHRLVPNPVTDHATLTITLATPAAIRTSVYDLAGREVWTGAVEDLTSEAYEVRIPTANLAPGHYSYRCTGTDGRLFSMGRFVKN